MRRTAAYCVLSVAVLLGGCSAPDPTAEPPIAPAPESSFKGGMLEIGAPDGWGVARLPLGSDAWRPSGSGVTLELRVEVPADARYDGAVTSLLQVQDGALVPFLTEQRLGLTLTGMRPEPLQMDLLLLVAVSGLHAPTTLTVIVNDAPSPDARNLALANGSDARVSLYREGANAERLAHRVGVSDDREEIPGSAALGPGRLRAWVEGATHPGGLHHLDVQLAGGPGASGDVTIATLVQGKPVEARRTIAPGFGSVTAALAGEGVADHDSVTLATNLPSTAPFVAFTSVSIPWAPSSLGLASSDLTLRGGL